MVVRVTTDWLYKGMRTIIVENDDLKLTILPDYGAKVFEFVMKKADYDLMYHNPRVEIRQPVFGVNVDNWWHGGIDECIPTGQTCNYRGQDYPYLGELWSLPWLYQIEKRSSQEVSIHLWRPTVIAPLLVERWMSISDHSSILKMRHRITNQGYGDFEFLWGIHPGLAITPNTRIDIPDSTVIIDESIPNNRLGVRGSTYRWPYATTPSGQTVDMHFVPAPETSTVDMHFATEFKDGWLAVTDTSAKVGFGLAFPKEIFKCIWLWLVYGGWRGLYCAAVEAWTGYPGSLDQAVKNGIYTSLAAGKSLECKTSAVGYTGLSKVDKIELDGQISGS